MADHFTLVVRCSDPRLEPFFADAGHRASLSLDPQRRPLAEAHIANVGGLLSLAGAEVPRLVHDAALLLGLFGDGSGHIVLTAHSACGGYLDAVEGEESAIRERQEDDLVTTAHRLRVAIPNATVECFYLDLDDMAISRVEA